MRALVVGGAGFIGSHLVERLIDDGHAVDVIDDLSTGSLANLATARRQRDRALSVHTLDARSPALADLVARRRPEVVYHLAPGSPNDPDDRLAAESALVTTLNVLGAAHAAKVGKVIVTLDAADLYGEIAVREQPVKEGHRTEPRSLAAVVVRSIVDMLAVYRAQHGVEFVALALSEVYGPRQRSGVIAELLALGDLAAPDPRRHHDLVYIDDAVDALVRAAPRGTGLVANIGSGQPFSRRDLVGRLRAMTVPASARTAVPTRSPRSAKLALSPVRARIHLGWEPFTDLSGGLAATIAWLDDRAQASTPPTPAPAPALAPTAMPESADPAAPPVPAT